MRRIDALKALTGKTMVGTFSVLTDTGEAWSAAEMVKIYDFLSEEIPEPKDDLCKPKAVRADPKDQARVTAYSESKKGPVQKVTAGSGKRQKLDDGKMLALRRAGWTYKAISEEMGCSEQTVINHIKDREGKG